MLLGAGIQENPPVPTCARLWSRVAGLGPWALERGRVLNQPTALPFSLRCPSFASLLC